jgi:glucosamine-6-phosphate deaminase
MRPDNWSVPIAKAMTGPSNFTATRDTMQIQTFEDAPQMGQHAAEAAAAAIRKAIEQRGQSSIIVATGASQFEVLKHLVETEDIAWNRVTAFHLDEYVGIPLTHPASFRLYLWQRLVRRLPLPLAGFHYLDGETDAAAEARRVGEVIADHPIDVALVGIGENGHLAFNDPPADFDTQDPYLVVELDEACRRQQLGEGWFASLDEVPQRAISMSVKQILKSRKLICSVPDERKAEAVQRTVEGPVTPEVPASAMQDHPDTVLYLDRASASRLSAGSAEAGGG